MDTRLLKSLMEKRSNESASNRLESLRLPRDLSLGGTKPKKIYAPNLNFVRKKDKAKESVKKLEVKKKEKPKPQPKKKVLDNKRFVQSKGVFSEGSAIQRRPTGFCDRVKHENDGPASMAIPTYKKDESVDNGMEDSALGDLIDLTCDQYAEDTDMWNNTPTSYDIGVKTQPIHPYFCKMEDDHGTRLALMTIPEWLPCKGLSDDPNGNIPSDYHLKMMSEGKIGCLQITRSGKTYMKIGDLRYSIEPIETTGGQESICTYVDPQDSTKSKIAILGDVTARFQLTPEWNGLWK